jgi:uncharacterized protein YsxB (DUF464 family)
MVKCKFTYIPNIALACEIIGHANYNPGNDIVCSSISALAYTLWGAVIGVGINEVQYREKPGDFMFHVPITYMDDSVLEKLKTIFLTVYTGINQIAGTYPENVLVDFINYDKLTE